jgi:hypothetical protein
VTASHRLILSAAGLLLLAGCSGDVEKDLGVARTTPDEFSVTTRAPLAMPPDESLPPPTPGAARPQEQSARQQALETIAPDVAIRGEAGADSAGQAALREGAAARAAAPARPGEIRGGVGMAGELAFWNARSSRLLVDADAENRRLRDAAANGEAPTTGATRAVAAN